MVLSMLRCSVVGEWIARAVGAEREKLIRDYKVFSEVRVPRQAESDERDNQDEMQRLDLRGGFSLFLILAMPD
jgi:hypothetical protein